MSPDEFRAAGRAFVDWAAAYIERASRAGAKGWESGGEPVASRVAPGDIAALLPRSAPESAGGWKAWLTDLDRVVMPGVTHWQSPRFFGFFPCNTTGPAILADIVSGALGAQGMMWSTSPAYTELETRTLDWLREAMGLPPRFDSRPEFAGQGSRAGGVIQGTASEAALVCIVAARDAARARSGAPIERLTAYTSGQAHSSIAKGARVAGLSRDHLRLVPVDARLRMRSDALAEMVAHDRAAGLTPFFVCSTVGTTSSASVDPTRAIGEVARREGLWLHIDAAYAGSAAVCPEFRSLFDGAELADSVNFNPHKWLLTTFDCSVLWVADRTPLIDALSITPVYLRNAASDSGAVIDYRDWQTPLGRRFRALKLWFVLRWYGLEGLRAHIRLGVALGELFESLVRAEPALELAAERGLGLVCFRVRDADPDRADARTKALHERLHATGRLYLTQTALPTPAPDGPARAALRMAIGGVLTREEHIREAFGVIREQAGAV